MGNGRFVVHLLALALVLAAAALPGTARAASASATTACEGGSRFCSEVTSATFTAAAGERNELDASYARGAFVFRDQVPISAGPGCEQRSPTEVACAAINARAELGDMPDAARAAPSLLAVDGGDGADSLVGGRTVSLRGGEGDDRLEGTSASGGAGRDVVIGSDGDDYLSGGADEDELRGGPGNDWLGGDAVSDGSPAPDVLDGGPGGDTVSYSGHSVPVEVDLAAQTGGSSGERDTLSGFENAQGGDGDDRLVGDERANELDGGEGANVLLGAGGNDDLKASGGSTLDGGDGNDALAGGPGNDALEGGPGDDRIGSGFGIDRFSGGEGNDLLVVSEVAVIGEPGESLACGAGADRVLDPHRALVPPDCEQVYVFGLTMAPYPRWLSNSVVAFRVECPRRRFCRGSVRLRAAGERRSFAERKFRSRTGVARVKLRVPSRIRGRADSPLRLLVVVTGRQNRWPIPTFGGSWVIDLNAGR